MTKKRFIHFLVPLSGAISGCRMQDAEEYSRDLLQLLSTGRLFSFLEGISSRSGYLYQFTLLFGIFLFLFSMALLPFSRRKSPLAFLGLSGLLGAAVYLTPLLALWSLLPHPDILILQVRTLLLLSYYLAMRSWGIRFFSHRRKPWMRITRICLISLVYLAALLAWFQPKLLNPPWIVPSLAVFILADSTVCSILSLQRKNDRSGYGGLLLTLTALAGAAWYLLIPGAAPTILRSLDDMAYGMPALILPVQFVLSVILIQAQSRNQQKKLEALKALAEEQEGALEKAGREYDSLQEETDEAFHIPAFHLKAARKALHIDPPSPLNLPVSWEGDYFINDNSTGLPGIAAWPFPSPQGNETETLLFVESRGEDRYGYLPLQMIRQQMQQLTRSSVSPVSLFAELNKSLHTLGEMPEHPLGAVFLHLLEDGALCGTAGAALVWYKKPGSRMVPVASAEVPSTLQQGLGFRPYSRETGRPFRLKAEKGDLLIIASRSLILREQELSGEVYGKPSLMRVLENHGSSAPGEILSAIIKDFDDFDMGNTRDRQVYAAVFRKT